MATSMLHVVSRTGTGWVRPNGADVGHCVEHWHWPSAAQWRRCRILCRALALAECRPTAEMSDVVSSTGIGRVPPNGGDVACCVEHWHWLSAVQQRRWLKVSLCLCLNTNRLSLAAVTWFLEWFWVFLLLGVGVEFGFAANGSLIIPWVTFWQICYVNEYYRNMTQSVAFTWWCAVQDQSFISSWQKQRMRWWSLRRSWKRWRHHQHVCCMLSVYMCYV